LTINITALQINPQLNINYNSYGFLKMLYTITLELVASSLSLITGTYAVDAYLHNHCSFPVYVQTANGEGGYTPGWEYVAPNNPGYKSPYNPRDGGPGKLFFLRY
jgi:hypothetical protein